jgi:hypothetical protein
MVLGEAVIDRRRRDHGTAGASRWQPGAALPDAWRAWLWLASALVAVMAAFVLIDRGQWLLGFDSHAYWAVDPAAPYGRLAPQQDAFLYSPPAVLVASAFDLLPWEVFREGWRALQVATLIAIAGPWAGPLALTPPVADEFLSGNLNLFLAAVVVAGFRWPAVWSIPLLTKVTPGIGLLWFAARGEWRALAIALGTTLAIAALTLALVPEMWIAWLRLLATQPADPPLVPPILAFPVRLAMAAILVILGARADRRWVVPFAVVFAHAHLWVGTMAILVALVPLVRAGIGVKPALEPGVFPLPAAVPRVAVPVWAGDGDLGLVPRAAEPLGSAPPTGGEAREPAAVP